MSNIFNKLTEDICKDKTLKNTDKKNILLWHLVFVIIIPIYLYNRNGFKSFRIYLPLIDLIAAGFVYVGHRHFRKDHKTHYFQGLYDLLPTSYLSYFSGFIINLLALSGVAIHSILWAEHRGIIKGILVAIAMYAITYLLPSLWLPTILDKIIEFIDTKILNKKHINNNYIFEKKTLIEEVLTSIIIIGLILFVEGVIIHNLILAED